MSTTIEKIQRQIAENPILLYMKGSPKLPSCGFSAQAVQALAACGERFAYVDILQNPDIRAELPKYANWPTFPQLWVDGELVGGCDIVIEMYQRCLLYTSDAADDLLCVDLGGSRNIKKKKKLCVATHGGRTKDKIKLIKQST